jgi:hypothetical protein
MYIDNTQSSVKCCPARPDLAIITISIGNPCAAITEFFHQVSFHLSFLSPFFKAQQVAISLSAS